MNSTNEALKRTHAGNSTEVVNQPTERRRVVYLGDDTNTVPRSVMCRIECPGFCACASKKKN